MIERTVGSLNGGRKERSPHYTEELHLLAIYSKLFHVISSQEICNGSVNWAPVLHSMTWTVKGVLKNVNTLAIEQHSMVVC